MLETLLFQRKKIENFLDYHLYLDFASLPVGTKTLQDKGSNQLVFTTRGDAAAAAAAGFGVVDVPGVGRCFQFNGVNYFYIANNPLKNFSYGSYDIEIGYVKPSTAVGVMFSTGTSNAAGDVPGTTVVMDINTASYIRHFQNRGSGVFQNNTLPEPNSLQFTEILIQKRKTGTVVTDKTSGVTKSFPFFAVNAVSDTNLTVGGHSNSTSILNGYMKYLRIKKVVD